MTPPATGPVQNLSLTDLPRLLQQTEGWAGLRSALAAGQSGTIDGAWGSAGSLAAAALAADDPPCLLVVVPSPADVGPWAEDLTSFLGTRPAVFPGYETWPPPTDKGRLAPETSARLRLLQQLIPSSGSGSGSLPPEARGREPGPSPGGAGERVIVAPMAAIVQSVPPRADLAGRGRRVKEGDTLDVDEFARWLVDRGYKRVEAVEYPGEFARRGGIIDLFPPDLPDPVRLELFGDEVESIRVFSALTQRSLEKRGAVTILDVALGRAAGPDRPAGTGCVTDYLPPGSRIALVEPGDLKEQAKLFFERVADQGDPGAGRQVVRDAPG